MTYELISVGIDVGTTTTQIVFSKLTLAKQTVGSAIPEVKIIAKTVLYESQIHFTPLLDRETIDYQRLERIIAGEYERSGFRIDQIATGAVIITGETARKTNARPVLEQLTGTAGAFVVSTAGPDLEGVLAGWGSGAGALSRQRNCTVTNFDIGGGTTNTAVFRNGDVIDSYALDLGGRLVQVDERGDIVYVSERIAPLLAELQLDIRPGQPASLPKLRWLTNRLAEVFLELLAVKPLTQTARRLFIGHRHRECSQEIISFSGGVAEFIYHPTPVASLTDLRFGDIGPLLGQSIAAVMTAYGIQLHEPAQTIRATVIGAGSHTLTVSGSTVTYTEAALPLKNLPVIKPFAKMPTEDWNQFAANVATELHFYPGQPVAVAFAGEQSPSYAQIKQMAASLINALAQQPGPLTVIIERDFAKALGQTIAAALPGSKPLICLDRLRVHNGDYIDIGKPIAGAVPVIVKTLVFNT